MYDKMCRKQTLACTCIDAVDPRVLKLRVARTATLVEPSASRSATTALARSLHGTALGARGTHFYRCRGRGDI